MGSELWAASWAIAGVANLEKHWCETVLNFPVRVCVGTGEHQIHLELFAHSTHYCVRIDKYPES